MQHDLHNTYTYPFVSSTAAAATTTTPAFASEKSAMLYDLNNIFEDRDDRPLFI